MVRHEIGSRQGRVLDLVHGCEVLCSPSALSLPLAPSSMAKDYTWYMSRTEVPALQLDSRELISRSLTLATGKTE